MARRGRSIKVSPKHGVNPSLETCFWCGKEMGVALLGRLKGDAEAPRHVCLGLEPCNDCKARFAQGVQIVEVSEDGSRFDGNKAFQIKDAEGHIVYPTGRFVVMKAEAIRGGKPGAKMLADKATMNQIMERFGQKDEPCQDATNT